MILAIAGYGLAAALFALLALLTATSWRGGSAGGLLALACGITAAWAALLATLVTGDRYPPVAIYSAEVLRDTAWLAFLARVIPGDRWHSAGGYARAAVWIGGGLALLVGVVALASTAIALPTVLAPVGCGAAVGGLVLLEQIYRNARPGQRAGLKFLLLGVGGLLVYDLFLYTHALLLPGIAEDLWAARGFANAIVVPLLAIAARRHPQLAVDLYVSRHVTFYAAALVGVGGYLLAMLLVGYGINYYGGSWGGALRILFFFVAAVALAVILLSRRLRSAARVFIAKHFYASRYDYRDEWLRLTATLEDDAEELGQRAIRALAQIVEARGGTLWLRRARPSRAPRWEKAATLRAGGPEVLEPGDHLLDFMRRKRWSVHATGVHRRDAAYEGLALPDWMAAFGAGALAVPLLQKDELYGIVVLREPRPGLELDYEDIDLLRTAGRQVAGALAQADADRQLTEGRQFEAYNRLTAFLMHDLKNLIAQQSLMVRNAASFRDDPEFIDDAIATIENSVERMQRLLEQLQAGSQHARRKTVGLEPLLAEVVAAHADRTPVPRLEFRAGPVSVVAEPERLGMVIGHVIRNAQDATVADGSVTVHASAVDGFAVITVVDDGAGMDEVFIRERLFKPFDSTKGAKGMGIGAYQARQFAEEAGGTVHVHSRPGAGTRFEIRLPITVTETIADEGDGLPAAAPPARERAASG
jgi:putative PEP-CTERM system histidine kinase